MRGDNDVRGVLFYAPKSGPGKQLLPASGHLSSELDDEGAHHVDIWGMSAPDKV